MVILLPAWQGLWRQVGMHGARAVARGFISWSTGKESSTGAASCFWNLKDHPSNAPSGKTHLLQQGHNSKSWNSATLWWLSIQIYKPMETILIKPQHSFFFFLGVVFTSCSLRWFLGQQNSSGGVWLPRIHIKIQEEKQLNEAVL